MASVRAVFASWLLLGLFESAAATGSAEPVLPMEDCIQQAAIYHRVNATVLKAMIFQESSGNPATINRNSNSTDYGAAGINSVHLKELAKFGLNETSLMNGCTSAFVGAWKYSQKIAKYGNTWKAVGAYHSETPSRRNQYSMAVQKHLVRWGHLPNVFSYKEDETSATTKSPQVSAWRMGGTSR